MKDSFKRMKTVLEIYKFLRLKKKLWQLPIILIMLLVGGLLLLAQTSIIGPFIYTFI
jgi:hypothetical protein